MPVSPMPVVWVRVRGKQATTSLITVQIWGGGGVRRPLPCPAWSGEGLQRFVEGKNIEMLNIKWNVFYYPPFSGIASCVGTAGMVT